MVALCFHTSMIAMPYPHSPRMSLLTEVSLFLQTAYVSTFLSVFTRSSSQESYPVSPSYSVSVPCLSSLRHYQLEQVMEMKQQHGALNFISYLSKQLSYSKTITKRICRVKNKRRVTNPTSDN